ncbi:fumarylacetoacetate hydrolase family protein [Streptomyces inhibens]|uniref:fumarylacetoacetate hydrolase family protein n=1 Tax=Streptomyces inhibens TaxID=2293571 RepID=UPI0037978AD8
MGLNYRRHADDLEVQQPKGAPGSYLRPNSTVIGYGDEILLPSQSERITVEAELGLVIGSTCRDVSADDAESVILGYTTVLGMTAEDVIRINPRHIPWSKAFDTFCSLGPWVVTPDEIPELSAVRISAVINGRTIWSNAVSAMMCDPHWFVGYFSGSMVLETGSVIATHTPGAGVVQDGDVVEALVEGVGMLRNRVRQAAPLAGYGASPRRLRRAAVSPRSRPRRGRTAQDMEKHRWTSALPAEPRSSARPRPAWAGPRPRRWPRKASK